MSVTGLIRMIDTVSQTDLHVEKHNLERSPCTT
jgi:hypothetical protein